MPKHHFEAPRGTLLEIEIDSKALAGNLLGDPTRRRVAVYLPEGYEGTEARYPLFVDLAGYTGSGLKRLAWTAFGESVPQRVDRLVAEGRMGPAIFAFPDCFTSLGGNQYVDSVAMGRWEAFLCEELVPELERRFRCLGGRAHRAVYGKSSGGYGALVHGMRHADVWGAVACHSGDMAFDLCYLPDFPGVLDALAAYDGSVERFLTELEAAPKMRGSLFHVLMILAMAATYDPDPEAYRGIRLPVDLHTCTLDPERWARWLAHDPVRLVDAPEVQENLRALRVLFIDCGRRDQYKLHYGARQLVARLRAYGIDHVYEEFDDDHSSVDYRLDTSLPLLYEAIKEA
ncbi:MAG: enterochelin esterase [Deltaproteobacteria bacterium]|nr:MAG: enterochelin esterase [Deltaproteobacteria bacterium]